jgi:GT2 family glycosyltransferase
MSKIALVTVLFKSDSVLEGFIKSISAQTFKEYHLFLIDNTPSEGTTRLLEDIVNRFPVAGYTHIQNPGNFGVAKGNNQGIELSLAQNFSHTLLLNNDIEFDQQDLFDKLIGHATTQGDHLIIPKIYFYDSRKIWMAGGFFRENRGIVGHVGAGESDTPTNSTPRYFDYAPTCFMLINNNVFRRVGLMDEKYFVYYDDVDFLLRVKKTGYRILYLPDLIVFHKVSSSTGGKESLFSIYYNTRNRIYFLRKNYKGLRFFIPMVVTMITRFLRGFSYNRFQNKEMLRAIGDGFNL